MRLLLVALVAGMMATGGLLFIDASEAPAPAGEVVVHIGEGRATYSTALQPGERFLKQVAMPEHIVNPYEPDPESEEPGDGYDDGLLVTQRRVTDHSWWTKPITGMARFDNIHGTPENPICICDTEFVLSNESGHLREFWIDIRDSSYFLVDNVTVYGGELSINDSHNVTITRSRFISGVIGTFLATATDVRVVDNDFTHDEGPLTAFRADPITANPTGINECWPNPVCYGTGFAHGGISKRWTVMWNYFENGGVGGLGAMVDMHVEHNTFHGPTRIEAGYHGNENVLAWNLARGFKYGGMAIGGFGGATARVENNSMVAVWELYPLSEILRQVPGLQVLTDCVCHVRNNDFVGYGSDVPGVPGTGGSPALHNWEGMVDANDNYWGTLHNPLLPENVWIRTNPGATTIVDRWFTEPVHDVTPVVVPVNNQDIDWWLQEGPKRIKEQFGLEDPPSGQ